MILLFILIGLAIVVLLLGWRAVKGQAAPEADAEELMKQIRHVDLHAFRNLFDPADEDYLRRRLSPQDFRSWRRMRSQAALEYVGWTSRNAALLLRIGEIASRNADASVALHGKQLASVALSLRINCMLATSSLYLKMVLPWPRFSIDPVFQRYAMLQSSFVSLRFAQHPSSVSKALGAL